MMKAKMMTKETKTIGEKSGFEQLVTLALRLHTLAGLGSVQFALALRLLQHGLQVHLLLLVLHDLLGIQPRLVELEVQVVVEVVLLVYLVHLERAQQVQDRLALATHHHENRKESSDQQAGRDLREHESTFIDSLHQALLVHVRVHELPHS